MPQAELERNLARFTPAAWADKSGCVAVEPREGTPRSRMEHPGFPVYFDDRFKMSGLGIKELWFSVHPGEGPCINYRKVNFLETLHGAFPVTLRHEDPGRVKIHFDCFYTKTDLDFMMRQRDSNEFNGIRDIMEYIDQWLFRLLVRGRGNGVLGKYDVDY